MSIKDEKFIKVYNKNNFVVTVNSREKPYVFAPIANGIPTMLPMSWEEIVFIHGNTSVFQKGMLSFDDDKQEEAMDALGIFNWRDIITNEEFEEIVKNPTAEGVQKILSITDMSTFERLRGIFYSMKNADEDVSARVEKVIEERFKELLSGKVNSRIVVTQKQLAPIDHEDIKDIRAKNDALNKELEALKAQMAALMASMGGDEEKDTASEPDAEPPKKEKTARARKTTK